MTLFFEHLNKRTGITSPNFSESVGTCMKKEALMDQINQYDKTNFEYLAERASLWRFLHRVQRSQLDTALHTDVDNNKRVKLIKETLWMATLLDVLHQRLNEERAAEPYRTEQLKLRKLLYTYDHTYPLETPDELPDESPYKANNTSDYLEIFHRWFTYNFDTTRLYLGHVRRICAAFVAAPEVFGYDYFWSNLFATVMGPILSFASLFVYLPRTLSNIYIILERCYEDNHEIDLKHRWMAHCELNDRLFNLVNDSPSVIAALLAWFVLSTAGLALVVYITVLVKFAEVIFSSSRAYFEATRFDALQNKYHEKYEALGSKEPEDTQFLDHLDRCIAYDKGRFITTAIHHGLLLFCLASFTPPLMALSPWVTIVAALAAMLVLGLRFASFRDVWLPECPNESLKILSNDRFFQPPPSEQHKTDATSLTSSDAPVSI
ncbi:MAG: hypothetical protein P1U36_04780 [Legionellaceae bacterium]|nr:hypothetical protein [Legionellaceae bacterium]